MSQEQYDKACGALFRKTIASYKDATAQFGDLISGATAASTGTMKDPETGERFGYRITIGKEGFEEVVSEDEEED